MSENVGDAVPQILSEYGRILRIFRLGVEARFEAIRANVSKPAQEAMTKLCKQRFEEFNTAGQAAKIKSVATPAVMATRYAKGDFDPKFA